MSKSYNQFNVPGPEYQVRPVVRYVVTRYCHPYAHETDSGAHMVQGGSEVIAEFPSEPRAWEVAEALRRGEREMIESAKQDESPVS